MRRRTRFINAGMLAEMLESIDHSENQCKYKIYYRNTRLINAGMLTEILENIDNL